MGQQGFLFDTIYNKTLSLVVLFTLGNTKNILGSTEIYKLTENSLEVAHIGVSDHLVHRVPRTHNQARNKGSMDGDGSEGYHTSLQHNPRSTAHILRLASSNLIDD